MSGPMLFMFSLCLALMSLSSMSAVAAEDELVPGSAQDALGLIASLQQAEAAEGRARGKAANMYELLQLAAREEGEELPLVAAFQDEYLKDKRGSYMSLCHFKICNMGRKRNPYWSRN